MKKPVTESNRLKVFYDSETDTLSLWNGHPACEGSEVGEGLTHLDRDGEVVGNPRRSLKVTGAYIWEKNGPIVQLRK